jgi:four helix bundle protein
MVLGIRYRVSDTLIPNTRYQIPNTQTMKPQSFTDLDVCKEARRLRKSISKLTKKYFTEDEKYRLTEQIIRSSRSTTANIAEGNGRFYYLENIKFCRIARGSLEETLEHLITAYDEEYITVEILKEMKQEHEVCMRLINGYISFLNKSKKGEI